MNWYVHGPIAAIAVLAAAEGIAGITSGWTLPWARGVILRPRLSGWSDLILAACLALTTGGRAVDAGNSAVCSGAAVAGALVSAGLAWWARQPPGTAPGDRTGARRHSG